MKNRHFYTFFKGYKPIRFFPNGFLRKKPYRFVGIFSFLLFFNACNNETEIREILIQQEVKNSIEKYKVKKKMDCIIAALDSANRIADSIIFVKMSAIDTSLLRRPAKPVKPLIKSPLDTTPVQPILQK